MPAPSCKLSAGFGSINISAIFLFFLSDSRFLLAKLYCLPLFLFFSHILQHLSSISSSHFIWLQWVLGYSFLAINDTAEDLSRRSALLQISTVSCRLSLLRRRIHSSILSEAHSLTKVFRHPVSFNIR